MTREQSIKDAMRTATPTLTLDDNMFSFSHLPPGGTNWVAGTGAENDIGRLTINYTWNLMTPLIRPFFTGGQHQHPCRVGHEKRTEFHE